MNPTHIEHLDKYHKELKIRLRQTFFVGDDAHIIPKFARTLGTMWASSPRASEQGYTY